MLSFASILISQLPWKDLSVHPNELRPNLTLRMGQCFNWKPLEDYKSKDIKDINENVPVKSEEKQYNFLANIWIGVISDVPLLVKQTDVTTEYMNLLDLVDNQSNIKQEFDDHLYKLLFDYFQLHYNLSDLYTHWSKKCVRMKEITIQLPGVRVVRQDPWECLISFITSSCNNIKRITGLLDKFRMKYGKYICTVTINSKDNSISVYDLNSRKVQKEYYDDNPTDHSMTYHLHKFPSIYDLRDVTEIELRELGFGYRAKFIREVISILSAKEEGIENYFKNLRNFKSFYIPSIELIRSSLNSPSSFVNNIDQTNSENYNIDVATNNKIITPKRKKIKQENINPVTVQDELMKLPGVGRKVADCVALFSLDKSDAIPVDTHVWEITTRDYASHLKTGQSLTPRIYDEVSQIFLSKFGEKCGWAHSVLFAAELPEFRVKLSTEIQNDMKNFSLKRKNDKQLKKLKKNKIDDNDMS